MNNRYNSGQNSEQIYQNSIQSYEFHTREVKRIKHGIPKPIKQNPNELSFSKHTNYQILNNYYQSVPAEQYLNNDRYRIKKVIFNDDYIAESYPAPQTDRNNYSKDRVIVYQKKISCDKSYNNNSVHFIKHNSKNINQNYVKTDNKKNNHTFKVSKGFIHKANQNKKLYVNHSSKNLYRIEDKKELKNPREKIFDEEITSRDIINKKTNYKIIDIKHQSNNDLNYNLNMTTPNNTRIHTIIYTNKKDDKLKEIPTPINLFANTEKKTSRKEIFAKERNIPKEINDYFAKNRINYRDRSKYINATLLIQTTFRHYLKNGKIQFNFIKKYVKFYRVINSIQSLFNSKKRYWEYFIDKLEKYEVKKHNYTKRKLYNQIPINKPKNNKEKDKIKIISINNDIGEEINDYSSKPKTIVRSQSRDIINVEKLIKEKEDLEKRLNQIMEENNMLKKINLSNKELLNKNIELTEKLDKTNQKTKKLEMENEKYVSEFSKTKDKYSKIENEVADVNMKLKITYLKFLLEKKNKRRIQIINKYFKRYRDISLKMKLLEEKNKNENEKKSKYKIEKVLSTAVKKNNEEIMKKRNKILMELFYNKDKERTRLLHSCFSKFYYKGMINQFKFRKSIMMSQLKSDSKKEEEERRKEKEEEEERRKEEEEKRKREEEEKRKREEEERSRLIYEEEQRQKREEEERKMEEERKNREEEEKRKQEEERKKEEEKIEEDKKKNEENTKRMNKINMERRKKLKKLLQDEKKQKLDLKREYFKKFHFRCFIFSSHLINKNRENTPINDNNNIVSKNEEEKEEKEADLKSQKELEELNKKKLSKLQTIFYKKDRKIIIIKKNILQRWNLIAKLISLGPKKKLRGRSKKRGDSKKRSDSKKEDKKEEEKPKKIKPKIPNIQNLKNKSENDKNSEDEKDKEDEKQNEN